MLGVVEPTLDFLMTAVRHAGFDDSKMHVSERYDTGYRILNAVMDPIHTDRHVSNANREEIRYESRNQGCS